MKIEIIGKNVKITEAMSNQILKKMERLEAYFDEDEEVNSTVLVSTTHFEQTIEISINTGSINLRVKVKEADMYVALDLAIDRLEGQMRKVKTQIDNKKRQASLGKHILFDSLSDYEEEIPTIIKKKSLRLTPMDEDEAITRMEALGHSFFIFLNSTTGLVNILYSRDDGNFGLIEVDE